MSKKRTSGNTRKSELPYNPNDRDEVLSFWKEATAHRGVAELRSCRESSAPGSGFGVVAITTALSV
jgi:hypothetical protein